MMPMLATVPKQPVARVAAAPMTVLLGVRLLVEQAIRRLDDADGKLATIILDFCARRKLLSLAVFLTFGVLVDFPQDEHRVTADYHKIRDLFYVGEKGRTPAWARRLVTPLVKAAMKTGGTEDDHETARAVLVELSASGLQAALLQHGLIVTSTNSGGRDEPAVQVAERVVLEVARTMHQLLPIMRLDHPRAPLGVLNQEIGVLDHEIGVLNHEIGGAVDFAGGSHLVLHQQQAPSKACEPPTIYIPGVRNRAHDASINIVTLRARERRVDVPVVVLAFQQQMQQRRPALQNTEEEDAQLLPQQSRFAAVGGEEGLLAADEAQPPANATLRDASLKAEASSPSPSSDGSSTGDSLPGDIERMPGFTEELPGGAAAPLHHAPPEDATDVPPEGIDGELTIKSDAARVAILLHKIEVGAVCASTMAARAHATNAIRSRVV